MSVKVGDLIFGKAVDNPSLIAPPIKTFLAQWNGQVSKNEILVAEINPEFSDSLSFCKKYNIPLTQGGNCLVIEAQRGNDISYAACLVPINSKANLNSIVRKHLNARRVSLAEKDFAVQTSGMEYGSITIIGLPSEWSLLIDESLISITNLVIGGGLRKSKLLIQGELLSKLPNATIIHDLASKAYE